MKIYIENFLPDSAISRISNNLKKYLPENSSIVEHPADADLVVICAYGHKRKMKYYIEDLLRQGIKYAVVQLSVRSTSNPKTEDWLPIWESSELVWSYYDLPSLCREDNNKINFNFYHAPLGVDAEIFKETPSAREYIIAGTGTGRGWNHECKNEIFEAAKAVNRPVFHLGTGENTSEVTYSNGMDDTELSKHYSQCEFVSGLRRIEGFELPVIEGLLCGARPICFDKPHFRQWFSELAEFIPEDEMRVTNLIKLFQNGAKEVSESEKHYVRKIFDWEVICNGFWKKAIK